MFDDLAASRYLMVEYAKASDAWESFRATGDPQALDEAATTLAAAWAVLADDEDFWTGAYDAAQLSTTRPMVEALTRGRELPSRSAGRAGEENAMAAELATYRYTDKLLARELVVLIEVGMRPVHAARLVTDLSDVLPATIEPVQPKSVEQTRALAPELAEMLGQIRETLAVLDQDLMVETARPQPPHRGWIRGLRTVGKALKATAGAAAVVANAAGAVASLGLASGFALGSVLGGLGTTLVTAADALGARRGRPKGPNRPSG